MIIISLVVRPLMYPLTNFAFGTWQTLVNKQTNMLILLSTTLQAPLLFIYAYVHYYCQSLLNNSVQLQYRQYDSSHNASIRARCIMCKSLLPCWSITRGRFRELPEGENQNIDSVSPLHACSFLHVLTVRMLMFCLNFFARTYFVNVQA